MLRMKFSREFGDDGDQVAFPRARIGIFQMIDGGIH
jgi:hypothetical protein